MLQNNILFRVWLISCLIYEANLFCGADARRASAKMQIVDTVDTLALKRVVRLLKTLQSAQKQQAKSTLTPTPTPSSTPAQSNSTPAQSNSAPASTSSSQSGGIISTLTLSASNIGYAGGCTGIQGAFTPSVSNPANVFNLPAASCTTPLTLINVGVTDAQNSCFLAFNFDTTILNQPQIQTLIAQGLYVGVICATIGTTNTVSAVLMDKSGKVYAQGSYTLAAGIGELTQYYVGFNTIDNNFANGTTSIGINAVPLNSSVLYKQASTVPSVVVPVVTPASAGLTPVGLVNGTLPTVQDVIAGQKGLVVYSGTANTLPLQELSTTRVVGSAALTPLSGADISTIQISLNAGYPIVGTFNLATIPALTDNVLQQGLYVQVDIVAAENVFHFALTKLIPNSYFYSSTADSDMLFVSLVDMNNNVYAAAAVSNNFGNNPSAYTVTLNQGMSSQAQQTVALTGETSYPAIFVQQASATSAAVVALNLDAANISSATFAASGNVVNSQANITNILNPTVPFSCQGGLTSLNVGATDGNNNFLSFEFDSTILGNSIITTLMQSGMYIGLNLVNASNSVTAVLMDSTGKVYAQGTYQLPSGTGAGINSWNIGFNTEDSNIVNGSTMLGYNILALSQVVLYQQLSTVSQPSGAVAAPLPQAKSDMGFGSFGM